MLFLLRLVCLSLYSYLFISLEAELSCGSITVLQNVLITSAGSWKFAGFGFAISEAQAGNLDNMQSFHYAVST